MRTIYLMVLTFLSSALQAAPEIKGTPDDIRNFIYPKENTVVLIGQAEDKAYADLAIVSLIIKNENKLLSVAIGNNNSIREAITKKLLSADIPADKINNSKFSSSPQFGWFGGKPSSYEVINRMAISIDKEDQLLTIAKVADEYSEVEFARTTFEHSKKDAFRLKVKDEALKKVMQQKAFYEATLGVKLIPKGITDSNINARPTSGAHAVEEIIVSGVRQGSSKLVSNKDYFVPVQKESSFEEIVYEALLQVEFSIQSDGSK